MKTPAEVQSYCGLTLSEGLSTMIIKTENEFIAVLRRDDCKIDFDKLKKAIGSKKIRMATAEEFIELTNLPLGAAQVYNSGLKTFIDKKIFEKEYLNGGSGSFTHTVQYKAEDLNKIPQSVVVEITKL